MEKHPRLGMFDRAPADKRLRLMFLMRLAPANFSLLNLCVCSEQGKTLEVRGGVDRGSSR